MGSQATIHDDNTITSNGFSSAAPGAGVNVAGAVAVAREIGPGHTIVTVLCDSGQKYQSRLYNDAWLAAKGLLDAARG